MRSQKFIARNIIITGASSGLGAALAVEYAEPGITLGLTGRNLERLEAVAAQCKAKGATVVSAAINVLDHAALGKWLHDFDDRHPIDLCIANAGISGGTGGGGETLGQVKNIFDVNVIGVIHTLHPVMDRMTARGKGQLALVSSLAGFRGSPTAPAYSASKAAVRFYGQALQGMLAPLNVQVSVIFPGFITTPMTDTNPFTMPMIMHAEKAAKIIKNGLHEGKSRIIFPLPIYFLVRLLDFLPDAVVNTLFRAAPAKT